MTITTTQVLEADGTFRANVTFDEPGTFEVSIYFGQPPLANGIPHIVGFAHPASDPEDCVAAWDSAILDKEEAE